MSLHRNGVAVRVGLGPWVEDLLDYYRYHITLNIQTNDSSVTNNIERPTKEDTIMGNAH